MAKRQLWLEMKTALQDGLSVWAATIAMARTAIVPHPPGLAA